MAFTVSRNGSGAQDAEFTVYTRLLRRQGIDPGKVPRAPEPGTGRRWLYAWDSREKAQAFADAAPPVHQTQDVALVRVLSGPCRSAWVSRAKPCRAATKEAFNTEAEREPRRATESACLPISRGRLALLVVLRSCHESNVCPRVGRCAWRIFSHGVRSRRLAKGWNTGFRPRS